MNESIIFCIRFKAPRRGRRGTCAQSGRRGASRNRNRNCNCGRRGGARNRDGPKAPRAASGWQARHFGNPGAALAETETETGRIGSAPSHRLGLQVSQRKTVERRQLPDTLHFVETQIGYTVNLQAHHRSKRSVPQFTNMIGEVGVTRRQRNWTWMDRIMKPEGSTYLTIPCA